LGTPAPETGRAFSIVGGANPLCQRAAKGTKNAFSQGGNLMTIRTTLALAGLACVGLAGAAIAQQPAAPPATTGTFASSAVANPTYAVIPMEIAVNKPAADVWRRVGKYCDISEWLQIAAGCTITAGKDGEVGAVRSVANEILVAKTELSYVYTQPVRAGRPYNLYHGNLEVRPVTPTTSKIVYTLMFDNSGLADDAARQADINNRRTTFMRALNNMKILAEGGTLPPPAAPAARGGGGAPAPGRGG